MTMKNSGLASARCSLAHTGFLPAHHERPGKWKQVGMLLLWLHRCLMKKISVITCRCCWGLPGNNWKEALPVALLVPLLSSDKFQTNLYCGKQMLIQNNSQSQRKYDLSNRNNSSILGRFIFIPFFFPQIKGLKYE